MIFFFVLCADTGALRKPRGMDQPQTDTFTFSIRQPFSTIILTTSLITLAFCIITFCACRKMAPRVQPASLSLSPGLQSADVEGSDRVGA